jgi:DNA-binding response OmpR family regulator
MRGGTKIILAEDEVLLRMLLADALRRERFEVIEAVDAGVLSRHWNSIRTLPW